MTYNLNDQRTHLKSICRVKWFIPLDLLTFLLKSRFLYKLAF